MGVHVDIKLDGEVGDYVAAITDGSGWYDSAEEYVRDLIRKDVERENAEFQNFRAELQAAIATPLDDCVLVSAEDVIESGRARRRA